MKPRFLFAVLFLSALFSLKTAHVVASQKNSLPAGNDSIISLRECLKLSVENSPRLKIADLEKIRLQYNYKSTVGMGLPQVNFSGSYDDYLSVPTQMIPDFFSDPPNPGVMIPVQFGTNFSISAGVDASQMLYNQSWLTALKMAKQLMQQNDLATEKTEIEVVYDVAQSYYLAQITLQQVRNLQSNLEKIEKAEKISQSQWENGLIKKIDLDRIVVQKLNMVTDIERLKVLYQQQLAMQKYFMGIRQEQDIALEDSISTSALIPGKEGDLNQHIDIRMIEKQKDLVNTNIRMDQSGYYPNLTLIGSANYMNQSNTFYLFGKPTDWFNTSLVGLRLSVPVFSGMQRHYKVSQTRVELEKLKINEDDARKLIRINSEDASRKLLNSIESEKRQRDNMALAERVYTISQEQYQKGVIPLTDLLTAETALRDAQANHIYALVQMKISELNYLKANGRLLEIL
ncbi:MAG: TolC family protein [Bacteroidales bacterium]